MTDTVSRVLIQCPETHSPVETVFRLRPSAFDQLKGEFSFRCSKCGQVHSWGKADAWLEAMGPRHM